MFSRHRWSRTSFLRAACDLMVEELDWDSLDSGSLHHATSPARTLEGKAIVVGVLDRANALPAVLEEAEAERPGAPLWLYVPVRLDLGALDEHVVVRCV